MRLVKWLVYFCIFFSVMINPVMAQETASYEQLQIPQCLAAKLSSTYTVLAENSNFKIISVPTTDLGTIRQVADQTRCGRFVNVSQRLLNQQSAAKLLQRPAPIKRLARTDNYRITHQDQVKDALNQITSDNIWQTLSQMTAFVNRGAMQNNGVQTAAWLKNKFEQMAIEYGRTDTATYYVATGGRYIQPSLITVIGKDLNAPAIVIGAHMDTLGETEQQRMPGAGDDGSGSAGAMEVARVLLASQNTFQRPIYIIWYAAEEEGLVGSQQVVQYFLKHNIPVHAVLQFDMIGFRNDERDKTMWVFQDYTDSQLSNFVAKLIQTYIKVPIGYSHCGYGCSDHVSWQEVGIPAAFPCETSFEQHNPYIHTASDTMDLLSLEHMTNFTKLGLAFALELALSEG